MILRNCNNSQRTEEIIRKSSGVLCLNREMLTDFSKNRTVLIFRVKISSWTAWSSLFIYLFLTVHFGVILVNNEPDAHFFYVCLFRRSTRFEQPCAHHQEIQLHQYDIWYMSLYVGDRLVCRFGRSVQTCIPDGQSDIYQISY